MQSLNATKNIFKGFASSYCWAVVIIKYAITIMKTVSLEDAELSIKNCCILTQNIKLN